MGRSELILLFGAIAIFGIYTLSVLQLQVNTRIANVTVKYEDAAVSLAESYYDLITNEKFDENVNNSNELESGESFTAPDGLGLEGAENISQIENFDDVDDYDAITNYTLKVGTPGEKTGIANDTLEFVADITVEYVEKNGGVWQEALNATEHKRVEIKLNSDYLPNEITYSGIHHLY